MTRVYSIWETESQPIERNKCFWKASSKPPKRDYLECVRSKRQAVSRSKQLERNQSFWEIRSKQLENWVPAKPGANCSKGTSVFEKQESHRSKGTRVLVTQCANRSKGINYSVWSKPLVRDKSSWKQGADSSKETRVSAKQRANRSKGTRAFETHGAIRSKRTRLFEKQTATHSKGTVWDTKSKPLEWG